MATLSFKERGLVERLLEMGSGYVLNFSDRTFEEFFRLDLGVEIYAEEFSGQGRSKARRFRSFLDKADNRLAMQALAGLIEHGRAAKCLGGNETDLTAGLELIDRLKAASSPADVTPLAVAADGASDDLILRQIQDSLRQDEPQGILDRLHTFTVRFVRRLCQVRGISSVHPNGNSKPLDSLFGEYVRQLRTSGHIESEMADKILRTSISVLSDFNTVRNSQSLAHDNPVLDRLEASLIVGSISNLIKFVQAVEAQVAAEKVMNVSWPPDEELPF